MSFPPAGPTPTMEAPGCAYLSTSEDEGVATRWYQSAAAPPQFPLGDFCFVFQGEVSQLWAAHPNVADAVATGLMQTYLSGSPSNDIYFHAWPQNGSAASGVIRGYIKAGGVSATTSGTYLEGTTSFQPTDIITLVLQSRAGTIELWACKPAQTAVLEASNARNPSFTNATPQPGNRYIFGRSCSATLIRNSRVKVQAFCRADQSLSQAEIETIAANGDLEAIITTGRKNCYLFDGTPSSVVDRWGSNNLARNVAWTGGTLPAGAAVIPNAPARLECTNEPPPYGFVAMNNDGTDPTHTFTGTWQGFDLTGGVEAQLYDRTTGTVITAWTALGSFVKDDTAGTWSGTLTVPVGGEYRMDFRAAADHSKTWEGTHPFLCGAVVVGIGQSQMERFASYGCFASGAPKTALDSGVKAYMTYGSLLNRERTWGVKQVFKVSDTGFLSGKQVGNGIISFLNAWWAQTGVPICYAQAAVGGTSSTEWKNDAVHAGGYVKGLITATEYSIRDAGRPKRIYCAWQQGDSDAGFSSATVKSNLDGIVSLLETRIGAWGGTLRFCVLPLNRDFAPGAVSTVRVYQAEWARDHPQAGTKVFTGPPWPDMVYKYEQADTALPDQTGMTSTQVKLAADGVDQAESSSDRDSGCTITIVSGTGAGQTRTGTAFNASTRVMSVTPAWTTHPDATSVYRTYGPATHQSAVGNANFAPRFALDTAYRFGKRPNPARGPVPTVATIVDSTHTDVTLTLPPDATTVRTPGGATTGLTGWQTSANGTTWIDALDASIQSANTIRLTHGSTVIAVRYGLSDPVPSDVNWQTNLDRLLYDDTGVAPKGGVPANFTIGSLTPTVASDVLASTGFFAAA